MVGGGVLFSYINGIDVILDGPSEMRGIKMVDTTMMAPRKQLTTV